MKAVHTLRGSQRRYWIITLGLQSIILIIFLFSFGYAERIKERDLRKIKAIHSNTAELLQYNLQHYAINTYNMSLELQMLIEANHQSDNLYDMMFIKLLEFQENAKSTGIFFLPSQELENEGQEKNIGDIYLRDIDPEVCALYYKDIYLHIGSSKRTKEFKIPIDATWQVRLKNKSTLELYSKPVEAFLEKKDPEKCGYFSKIGKLTPNDVSVLTYSVPITDNKGTLLGVFGIELSDSYLRDSLSIKNTPVTNTMTLLTNDPMNQVNWEGSLLCGYYESIIKKNLKSLVFIANDDGSWYTELGQEEMTAYKTEIILYNKDVYYSNQKWSYFTIVPKAQLDASAREVKEVLVISLLVSIAITIIKLVVLSFQLMKPVSKMTKNLELAIENSHMELTPTHIREFDTILERILEYGRKEGTSLPVDLFEEFISRTQSLTPTEKEVFSYYIDGCSIQEVAMLMFISINTLKVHNKHIYAKLDIGSKDELNVYIEFLKKSHMLHRIAFIKEKRN